ncbi:MAG: hypothetical protein EBS51_16600, partial [Planctomycetia bacterium]|nr:hypothetical protein [Planctomycetia bacterium]
MTPHGGQIVPAQFLARGGEFVTNGRIPGVSIGLAPRQLGPDLGARGRCEFAAQRLAIRRDGTFVVAEV